MNSSVISIGPDSLQAEQSSIVTKMVLCEHDEDCLLLCPLLDLIREAAVSKDEAYCQFVFHTSFVLVEFMRGSSALSSLNAERIFKEGKLMVPMQTHCKRDVQALSSACPAGSAHLGSLACKVKGAFEQYSIGQVFKLLIQHQQAGSNKPETVLRSIFFARMGVMKAAEAAFLAYDPLKDGLKGGGWKEPGGDASSYSSPAATNAALATTQKYPALLAAGDCSAWEAAMHNMGLLTSYIMDSMDSSSRLDLDVLTLFKHGIGGHLPRWLTEFENCPPRGRYEQGLACMQAVTVGWLPWLCTCSVQGGAWKGYPHLAGLLRPCLAQILEFLSMLALRFPSLKPLAATRCVPPGREQGLRHLHHMR